MHWSQRSIPELAGYSVERRRALWTRARAKVPAWVEIARMLIATAGAGFMIWLSAAIVHGPIRLLILPLCGLIGAVAGGFLGEPLTIDAARRNLRAQLGTHCRQCDYCFKGNYSPKCPECGTAVFDFTESHS